MYLEVLTCQSMSSPHVIQLYGVSEMSGMAYIVMPYYSNGNAIAHLSRARASQVYQGDRLSHLVHRWVRAFKYCYHDYQTIMMGMFLDISPGRGHEVSA